MLADDTASRIAWLGENGAIAAMDKNAIAIESSTISPEWIAELHTSAQQKDIRLIDAPVTGSRLQAESGQLTFLAGGDEATIREAQPVFEAMGKRVLSLGVVGSGTQLKLINNFLCGVQVASFAEALTWIERNGLDRSAALEFLKTAAPGSGILTGMSERMTERTYEVNFVLDLMRKDLSYAQTAAAAFGVTLSSAKNAEELFMQAQADGLGEKDMSAVIEVLRARGEAPCNVY